MHHYEQPIVASQCLTTDLAKRVDKNKPIETKYCLWTTQIARLTELVRRKSKGKKMKFVTKEM